MCKALSYNQDLGYGEITSDFVGFEKEVKPNGNRSLFFHSSTYIRVAAGKRESIICCSSPKWDGSSLLGNTAFQL